VSRKYEVQAGDTLFAISKRFYGEPTYFGLIVEANPQIDPNKISPGQTIGTSYKFRGRTESTRPGCFRSTSPAPSPPGCAW
jgi:LysM repeat protein